jgi:hypothetical protein
MWRGRLASSADEGNIYPPPIASRSRRCLRRLWQREKGGVLVHTENRPARRRCTRRRRHRLVPLGLQGAALVTLLLASASSQSPAAFALGTTELHFFPIARCVHPHRLRFTASGAVGWKVIAADLAERGANPTSETAVVRRGDQKATRQAAIRARAVYDRRVTLLVVQCRS